MATQQQKAEQIASIKDRFRTILDYDIDRDIIRNNDLGSILNFESLRPTLNKFVSYIKIFDQFDLNNITYTQLVKFNEALGQPHALLNSINKFNINQSGDLAGQRNRLISNFETLSDSFFDAAGPVQSAIFFQEPNNNIQSELSELINKVKSENEAAKNEAHQKLQEINKILENAKSASVKVGVTSYSTIFENEAIMHDREAKNWLMYLLITLGATAIIAILFFLMMFSPTFQEVNINPVQFSISKIVILAIFFVIISICTKNYKAHKHNSILNRHRQNALNTFETFVKAGSDEQTKNAVLLQTTQSIFSSHNTGYNSAENDSDVPSKIIEIVKSTGSKSQA